MAAAGGGICGPLTKHIWFITKRKLWNSSNSLVVSRSRPEQESWIDFFLAKQMCPDCQFNCHLFQQIVPIYSEMDGVSGVCWDPPSLDNWYWIIVTVPRWGAKRSNEPWWWRDAAAAWGGNSIEPRSPARHHHCHLIPGLHTAHSDVSVVMVTDTSTINDGWDPTYSIFVALDGPNLRLKYQFHHLDAGFRVTVVTHKNLCKE